MQRSTKVKCTKDHHMWWVWHQDQIFLRKVTGSHRANFWFQKVDIWQESSGSALPNRSRGHASWPCEVVMDQMRTLVLIEELGWMTGRRRWGEVCDKWQKCDACWGLPTMWHKTKVYQLTNLLTSNTCHPSQWSFLNTSFVTDRFSFSYLICN